MKVLFLSDVAQNLALMKLARDEVNQGNEVGLKFQVPDIVYCSWVFKRNVNGQARLDSFREGVEIHQGGFYVDPLICLPNHIEHLMPYYPLYEKGGKTIPRMGYTSRGCDNKCPWCIVYRKEGGMRDTAWIEEFWDAEDQRLYLLDNSFMESPKYRRNMDFLIEHQIKVNFHQGLNIRTLTERQASDLSVVSTYLSNFKDRGAFFAWDDTKDEDKIMRGIERMLQYWVPKHLNFYVLGGYPTGDEFDDVYYRCKVLTGMGIRPYIMPFETANKKIRALKRCISIGAWRKKDLDRAWGEYTRK